MSNGNDNKENVKKFICEFNKYLEDSYKKNDIEFKKKYDDRPVYTNFVKCFMSATTAFSGSTYYPEFYDIDYTWWRVNNNNSSAKRSIKIRDWKLDAVVEHENDWKDWTYEVAKLDFINSPIKIVIGYMNNTDREKEKDILKEQVIKLKNTDNEKDAFCVVLINRELKDDNPFDMRCYFIKNGNIEETLKFGDTKQI